jgi:hypothetical protein
MTANHRLPTLFLPQNHCLPQSYLVPQFVWIVCYQHVEHILTNCSFLSSLHIYPEPFLPVARGDPRPPVLRAYQHVEHLLTNCSFLSSLHIYPEPFLPVARGDPRPPVLHAYRHVEPWLHSLRTLHRLSSLPGREWSRAVSVYHGTDGTSSSTYSRSGHQAAPILW